MNKKAKKSSIFWWLMTTFRQVQSCTKIKYKISKTMMSDHSWQQFDNKIWDNNESLWSMTNFRWKDTGLRMKSKLIHWINDWYAWQQEHFLELIWEVFFFRTKKYIPAVNFCKTVNYAKISWIKIINQSQVWRTYWSSLENCADSICVINRQRLFTVFLIRNYLNLPVMQVRFTE